MTGLTVRRLLVLALVIVSGVRVAAGQPGVASDITRQPSGTFVFTDPGSRHPITVWFCRPPSLAANSCPRRRRGGHDEAGDLPA